MSPTLCKNDQETERRNQGPRWLYEANSLLRPSITRDAKNELSGALFEIVSSDRSYDVFTRLRLPNGLN
jgi:hypothetical protein